VTNDLLIINARLVTPGGVIEYGWISCRNGRIRALGSGDGPFEEDMETINAEGFTVMPGFIDVHVHGGGGYEAMDATPDALRGMARFYAQHGVTSFLATTWTDTRERITAALKAIAEVKGPQEGGATILGAHLEGPYLNPEKCGAQNVDYIRRAARDEAMEWLDLNVIKLVALAPEYVENHWLIEECQRRGIVLSAAHTSATYEDMCEAVNMGLRQTTHTYNAMNGLNHRSPGAVGAAMVLDEINCELICDNIHVHPVSMKVLADAKGPDKIIIITDAVRGSGMPEGDYQIDERVVTIRDGAVRLPNGTLAGSILTFEEGVRNFMRATGWPLEAASRSASLTAARALRIDDRKGSLAAGKDADLVMVDEDIAVHLTVAQGQVVYRSGI
jgi:N-acetylglucosamine-6-phosphate deacetylase